MLRKRGKIYYYQTQVNGKKRTWSTGESDRRRALEKVPELKRTAQLLRARPENSRRLDPAIVAEVDRLETEVSKLQAERVKTALKHFAAWAGSDIELARIDAKMVQDYQRQRVKDKMSRSTIEKELMYLLRMLRLNGITIPKPKPLPSPYCRNRRFSDEELALFFRHSTVHYRHLWLILLATGARIGEFVPGPRSSHTGVMKSEVDLVNRTVHIRPCKLKPNEEPINRNVKFPKELLSVIKKQIASTPDSYPYLFYSESNAKRGFNDTLKRAGIEKVNPLGKITPHSFRVTYLTKMGEVLNGNAWLLKEVAGHKSITTTQIYCQPTAPVIPISMVKLMPNRTKSRKPSAKGGGRGRCQPVEVPSEEEKQVI